MGNARWRGARLKDVLAKAGVRKDAVEVAFDGADGPVVEGTPDFVKSVPLWKALEEEALVAYEMNGEPLPHWNGFPARIVIPGWTATYWVKHVTSLEVRSRARRWFLDEVRLPSAERAVPDRAALRLAGRCHQHPDHRDGGELDHHPASHAAPSSPSARPSRSRASPGTPATASLGSTSRSTTAAPGSPPRWARISAATRSAPGASSASLGAGSHAIRARAVEPVGQTQVEAALFNPPGYQHNVIPRIEVTVS